MSKPTLDRKRKKRPSFYSKTEIEKALPGYEKALKSENKLLDTEFLKRLRGAHE